MLSRLAGAMRRQAIGVIALFIALGGTSYSALGPGVVGTKAIKDGEVTSRDIRDRGVRSRDLGPGSVTGIALAKGSVTGDKVAAETLTPGHIADGPGSGLNADLLDGADLADLQSRTVANCPAGEFLRSVAPNGSTACGLDVDSGGDITAVTAGGGLAGGATSGNATLSLAPQGVTGVEIAPDAVTGGDVADGSLLPDDLLAGSVQLPLSAGCAAGQMLRTFSAGGNPTCAADANSGGDITAVTAGTGLTGGASTGSATLGIAVPLSLSGANDPQVATFTQTGGPGGAVKVESTSASSFGHTLQVSNAGTGRGINVSSVGGNGIETTTSSISAAGLVGRGSSGEVIVGTSTGAVCESGGSKCSGIGAVVGRHDGPLGYGVRGFVTDPLGGNGVLGQSGISGGKGVGVRGENVSASNTSNAIEGVTNGTGAGIYGSGSLAGQFDGAVKINGNLTVTGTKSGFVIDDPRDPENSTLAHTPVESDRFTVTYSGNVRTDDGGEAAVRLPDYAEEIAGDWRYGLTPIGVFAQAIVGEELEDGRFLVRTDQPSVKVSWVVIGTRHDPFAERYPFRSERRKAGEESGHYIHPGVYGENGSQAVAVPETPDTPIETELPSTPAAGASP